MTVEEDVDVSATKYLIHVNFSINGVAEKSDVIGAVFGQTEGLIGDGLDLRELQKTSRIGRIVVKLSYNQKERKTRGHVIVPSSLDRIETAVLAASLETVDRVGPCVAKINLEKVEDVRQKKRDQVVKRAASILKRWEREISPEAGSIIEEVVKSARTAIIVKYGPENVPAAPGINESDSLIVVEGRADVLNLMKHGFRNAIASKGTNIPNSVIELSKRKVTTLFLDGDRGGDLILKEFLHLGDIDYVARAPNGREVEDLTGKEILKALRNKTPIEQLLQEMESEDFPEASYNSIRPSREVWKKQRRQEAISIETSIVEEEPEQSFRSIPDELSEIVNQLDPREGVIIDGNLKILQRIPVNELKDALENEENDKHGVIFNGIVTQRLLDVASQTGIKVIVGAKLGETKLIPRDLEIYEFAP